MELVLYGITISKKGIIALSLCREYNLNYKTAYDFRRKVQNSMKRSLSHLLEGLVHVDEFMYGSKEMGCQGRNASSKKIKVSVALELKPTIKNEDLVMFRAYAYPIKDYANTALRKYLIYIFHQKPRLQQINGTVICQARKSIKLSRFYQIRAFYKKMFYD